jgi:hypothetical protein
VVNDAIFGGTPDSTVPLAVAIGTLAALFAGCIVILERRVRAVDVVA